ncbi:sugar ABC transporter substrate-binding protein [Rhizobium sp. S152]|uniref:ABC transporter substrate-binding protein n=1 Tax=Rhizobium sp. S152 TaxID=3055038 RepID=UPI0025A96EFD|nr:sugar ABC transporter substrate-binding protein [Rhizobium sp. S152]MDM9628527.1 sugar ABC transporter substrate-binding protein [Rhizobium sp. S152]
MDRRKFLIGAAATSLLARAGPALASTPITYWHHFTSQTEFSALQKVVDLFKSRFPDIALQPENIPNSDYMAKMAAAVVASAQPDTAMIEPDRLADLIAMKALVDITDRFAKWDGRENYPGARISSLSVGDRVYGVPSFAFIDWSYYRTDYFEQAGLDGPPKTMDAVLTACKKLTDPSKGRYAFGLRGGAGGFNYLISVMEAFGSPVFRDGKPAMDRQAAIDAVTFYSDIFLKLKAAPPSAPSDGYRQTMEGFRSGQTAMLWHHTGSYNEVAASLQPGKQFGTAMMPAGPKALVARVSYAGNGIVKSANADAAWEWVKFWGEKDASIILLKETGYFPASTAALQDERIAANPLYQPAVKTLDIGTPLPSFVGYAAWAEKTVNPAFQSVLTQQSTPTEAVDTMIKGLEAIFH